MKHPRPVQGFAVLAAILLTVLPVGRSVPQAEAANPPAFRIAAHRAVDVGEMTGFDLVLPSRVSAFDARVYVAAGAAEVVGLATFGPGTSMRPELGVDGWTIGAYGLAGGTDATHVQLVIDPLKAGWLQVRVVFDAASDAAGNRISTAALDAVSTLQVGSDARLLVAPAGGRGHAPSKNAARVRELHADGKFDQADIDEARTAWQAARVGAGGGCASGAGGDANGDECVDIVDVQASLAATGSTTTSSVRIATATAATLAPAAVPGRTFTVTSSLDTPDASAGNGLCADSSGLCTLRAALTEADYLQGDDRIEFNLVGNAPVVIQIGSRLPLVTSRNGSVTIDGYTQPGSQANSANVSSNGVPGVEIRGNGSAAKEYGLYITSMGNTVRGLVFANLWRGVMVDGADAYDNRIVGNWVGFHRDQSSSAGQYGILLNTGAHGNVIGSPALADRNIIGNYSTGIDEYGPGTDANVVRNNQFCIAPNGLPATCNSGIDHNFGPKNELLGGLGTNERNIFGPSRLQGIEFSHGYNPVGPPDTDFSPAFAITGNQIVGNWVGFKADGSYDAGYRSGLNFSSSDNDQGINVYDGASDNVVDSNFVASVYDGIQVEAPTALRNIVRNNTIGVSPLGQAAPLTGWGLKIRWGTKDDVIQGNVIRNAAAGGIGLLNTTNTGGPLAPAYNVKLTRNIITDTNGPAIDLFGVAGPDPNDPGDGDTGANTLLNSPTLLATNAGASGTALAGATVELYRASRAEGAYGLPVQYLGSATAAGNGSWSIPVSLATNDVVTALQIATDLNTSELAANVLVASASPTAPSFTSASSVAFTIGNPGTFTITTSGYPSATIRQTGALPSGVTFNDNGNGTASLAGTPAAGSAGTYALTLTASNGVNPDGNQSFSLVVRAAPTITSAAAATFTTGQFGTFTVTATGSPTPTVALAGSLPTGVSFVDNRDGSGTISGTPSPGTAGTYPLSITAANGIQLDATQSFTLTIDPAPAGAPFAVDTFSRTLTGAWGSAETGGAWTLSGGTTSFSVDGASGNIVLSPGATRTARLGSVSFLEGDLSASLSIDKLPVSGSVFAYLSGRQTSIGTEYRAKVRIASDGRIYAQLLKVIGNTESALGSEVLVGGVTLVPGAKLGIRTQFLGANPTTFRMRVWALAGSEPSTWNSTASNSDAALQGPAGVAVRGYVSGTTSNGPITLSFDDLRAVAP